MFLYSLEKKLSQGTDPAKSIVNGLSRKIFEKIAGEKERVFFVYGMRRSGNHACINWLVNSLERECARRISCDRAPRFSHSESCDTFVMNEINAIGSRAFIRQMMSSYSKFSKSRFLIISAEDVDPSYTKFWRVPARSTKIRVKRKTTNLLASRYQSLNRYASLGRSHDNMKVDDEFAEILRSLMQDNTGYVFDFEKWSNDPLWRHAFLEILDLDFDLLPQMSREGGGSSFSGSSEISDNADLESRFLAVTPKNSWKKFLRGFRDKNPELFTEKELMEVDHFLSN